VKRDIPFCEPAIPDNDENRWQPLNKDRVPFLSAPADTYYVNAIFVLDFKAIANLTRLSLLRLVIQILLLHLSLDPDFYQDGSYT